MASNYVFILSFRIHADVEWAYTSVAFNNMDAIDRVVDVAGT